MSVDEAEYCARLVRQDDRDRWLCALFAPERARPGVLALSAFYLELARVREAVREPHMALIRLQWWRETLAGCAAGAPRRHPVAAALAPVLEAHPAIEPLLQAMIDARETDIEDMPFLETADLIAYADATSGGLARAHAIALAGAAAPATQDSALALGRGWALVGLLRAAGHLAARRRCPVPASLLARHGIDPEDWFARRGAGRAAGPVAAIAHDAAASFAAAERRDLAAAGLALAGLGVLGRSRLRLLAAAGHDPFAPDFVGAAPTDALRLAWARLSGRW